MAAGSAELSQTIAANSKGKSSYYFSTQELAWMTYGLASRGLWNQTHPLLKAMEGANLFVLVGSVGWDLTTQLVTRRINIAFRRFRYLDFTTEGVRECSYIWW